MGGSGGEREWWRVMEGERREGRGVMKGGGGEGSDGRGWDGSDVGRSLLFIRGGSLSSMGGGSRRPGALSCSSSCRARAASFVGGGRRLWAWGAVWGRGISLVGVGRRLGAWGAVWGRGVSFVGMGHRLWTGGGCGCGGRLVVGVVMLMVVVVVVVLVVVVVALVVVVVVLVVVVLTVIGVVLVVVVVVDVVVVVLLVVVVAVLALWPARCRALLVTWRCHVVVAVVSMYGVGREPLSTVESGGGCGLWC